MGRVGVGGWHAQACSSAGRYEGWECMWPGAHATVVCTADPIASMQVFGVLANVCMCVGFCAIVLGVALVSSCGAVGPLSHY
jgi:hypothetical protein